VNEEMGRLRRATRGKIEEERLKTDRQIAHFRLIYVLDCPKCQHRTPQVEECKPKSSKGEEDRFYRCLVCEKLIVRRKEIVSEIVSES